ncbi:Helicase conserved C-terminal domain-containing protein [Planctomicrobium piriforme]|uniref:Helicase conserved C-terminal domain-containing protein n=1 Tax=Planctomicrobium piriforme TaxID=1576369 RepID=A0A1I3FT34_9PLAN|nr:DEAD/DEAH box helicase [Planctomicrobium piriforme]SFI14396.1 Helicase conserved C-terminal domain-containing protein [Planctomicrobium piriforme]
MTEPAAPVSSRDDLAVQYLDQLLYPPYKVQEDAILTWFSDNEGILVCAPTGTGKTLIAEAALFEALHTGKTAYYTTPLIALSEQKFTELQAAAVRWGFSADDIGLLTGNRKVNPQAPVLVVVAEILLNRLLHAEGFDFADVSAVVMDEFHSFNDPERGVVWELSLALLPKHVRLMLLSATVGNAVDFLLWLRREHGRKVQLIQGQERKVPLEFNWVGEELLPDHLEQMQEGTAETRRTPALVFCFNREECWSVAEQLKGRNLLRDGQQKELAVRLDEWNWKVGAGPKLKQILLRGVGVHHAGLLPKYRRRVEQLFQDKLLSVCICTETLAAGINLPARSVVLTSLVKGPPGKKTLVDPSTAHQIFGRAGRPQFDTQGYVFALAHEDDVKLARWKKQYDQIPEDTKDPNLLRAKKQLKKKMPKRRVNEQYWNQEQFQKIITAPPAQLSSKGQLPWRLLAYLIQLSPDVSRLMTFMRKRLLPIKMLEKADERLSEMLLTMASGGFVTLDPPPAEPIVMAKRDWPMPENTAVPPAAIVEKEEGFGGDVLEDSVEEIPEPAATPPEELVAPEAPPQSLGMFGSLLQQAMNKQAEPAAKKPVSTTAPKSIEAAPVREVYLPKQAQPTDRLAELMMFRSCHPLYGMFLLDHLGLADRAERIQLLESVLEIAGSIISYVRVPPPSELPPGPLAVHRIDPELMRRGLITQRELDPGSVEPELDAFGKPIRVWPVPLGDKLRRLFDNEFPGVQDLRTRSVWVVGDLIAVGGDFHKYVTTRDLTKQEGVVFRHCLRMILLCEEFAQVCPVGTTPEEWQADLSWISEILINSCREVDPESTDKVLESMEAEVGVVLT